MYEYGNKENQRYGIACSIEKFITLALDLSKFFKAFLD